MENYIETELGLEALCGRVITKVTGLEKLSTFVTFFTECGLRVELFHCQSCCETVELVDFEGVESDVIGGLVVSAEMVRDGDEYTLWTFYKIETTKGGLWLRWLGENDSQYSIEVNVDVYVLDNQ